MNCDKRCFPNEEGFECETCGGRDLEKPFPGLARREKCEKCSKCGDCRKREGEK